MNDPAFMARALKTLDDLRALVLDRNRRPSNRALDQLADDIAGVAIRFVRGSTCSGPRCRADTTVEPISTESYCSSSCRGASIASEINEAVRVAEAMEQYREDEYARDK
jgi:hypothetical protein